VLWLMPVTHGFLVFTVVAAIGKTRGLPHHAEEGLIAVATSLYLPNRPKRMRLFAAAHATVFQGATVHSDGGAGPHRGFQKIRSRAATVRSEKL